MALPILSVPQFPNVPALPGVPPLLRSAATLVAAPQVARLTADVGIVKSLLGVSDAPQWGIFTADGSKLVLETDNTVSVRPTRDFAIADYPVENGGFQSYNKVAKPREVTLVVSRGGPVDQRTRFLSAIKALVESTDLFTLVQPEGVIKNMNVTSDDYDRSALEGMQLITVTLRLREVRVAPPAAFSSTKDAASAAASSGNAVQAQALTSGQLQAFLGGAGA